MEYIVDEKFAGSRVDRVLKKFLEDTPLADIFKGLKNGNIRVNGKKTKENARLELGDVLTINKMQGVEKLEKTLNGENLNILKLSDKEKDFLKSIIFYEDEKVVVINKPDGVVMHAGSGHEYGLSEMFQSYYKSPDFGFVNRIDKATSGLVVGAKTLPVARELSQEIRENKIDKRYLILVEGTITKDFTKISYLLKTEEKVIELDRYQEGAKESVSHFKVLKNYKNITLLEGALDSGRTHQLRVQLSSIKHPIIGDVKYHSKMKSKRMMLHSYYLHIPIYNLKIELPIPDQFLDFVKKFN